MRKYDTTALIEDIVTYMTEPVPFGRIEAEKMPWVALLAIKWSLADQEAFSRFRSKPNRRQTMKVLNAVYDMSNSGFMPDDFASLYLFMKAMAFQQFHLQGGVDFVRIARQFSLFDDLPSSNFIKQRFASLIGIDMKDFIFMSLLLVSTLPKANVDPAQLQRVILALSKYFPTVSEKMISMFSISLDQARVTILKRDEQILRSGSVPRNPVEFFEQSLFYRKPFLLINNQLHLMCRQLLYRSLEYGIFDILRADSASRFMSNFGPAFERHIENVIKWTGLPYATESDIKLHYRPKAGTLLIDFIINEPDSNIYVDAKGVELHYNGQTALNFSEMSHWVKDSLLKAIKQAHDVLLTVTHHGSTAVVPKSKTNYLLVVTYKDHFISNGPRLIDVVGADFFEQAVSKYPKELRIPPEHMYFVTVDEFEAWMAAVQQRKTTISGLINDAMANDSDPQTSKYVFTQHLEEKNLVNLHRAFWQTKINEMVEKRFPDYWGKVGQLTTK